MRLRRLLAASFAALVLGGVAVGPASADKVKFTDGDGSCADLFNGGAGFSNGDTVSASADVATPSLCKKDSYVASVYTPEGQLLSSSTPTSVTSPNDSGGSSIFWTLSFPAQPTTYVCVTIESRDMKGAVLDSAPNANDAGCAIGGAASGPPAGNWI